MAGRGRGAQGSEMDLEDGLGVDGEGALWGTEPITEPLPLITSVPRTS